MKMKTILFLKTRILQSKRLLQKVVLQVNKYGQALLQYQSEQQQQQQQQQQQKKRPSKLSRPQYSQEGGGVRGLNAQQDAKAIDKINRLASRITVILDEMMILVKSKQLDMIYSKMGAILYYLDFILDPFLSSTSVMEFNTWSMVPVKMITTNPLRDTMMATSLSTMISMVAQNKKRVSPPKNPFYLLKGQPAQTMMQAVSSAPRTSTSFDLADMLPTRKRARQF